MTSSADPAAALGGDFEPLEYRPGLHLLAYRGVVQPARTVLFFHGGGWFAGDPLQFAPQCAALAQHGIAGVTAAYRVHARHGTMVHDAIEDAVAATARLRQLHPRSPVFLCGASAGGLLAILAAAGGGIRGLILFNPVLDLSHEGFRNPAVPDGGDRGISPMHMAKAALPPMLILQGTADTVTPLAAARRYADAVTAAGGSATLVTYPGGHGFFNTPGVREVTTAALRQFVESTAPPPVLARPAAVQPHGGTAGAVLGYRCGTGGLTNQKLALLGLFMAARKTGARRLHLPDLSVAGQNCTDDRAVPFGSCYSADAMRRFAERHGIEILPGPARDAADAEPYSRNARLHIARLQDKDGIAPGSFTCGFLRHLTAILRTTPLMRALSHAVFAERGIGVVVQLRIDPGAPPAPRPEDPMPPFLAIIAKVAALPEAERGVHAIGDEAALPVPRDELRAAARQLFGIDLWWTSDLVAPARLDRLHALDRSILDFEIAATAPVFVGATRSAFSSMVGLDSFSRRQAPAPRHYSYNPTGPLLAARTDNGAFRFAGPAFRGA